MNEMDRKEIKRLYKEELKPMGVYQIVHKPSGKAFIGNSMNLPSAFNRERFTLKLGSHRFKELQADWNKDGEDQFSFEILEEIKPEEGEFATEEVLKKYRKQIEQKEKTWRLELQAVEAAGYHESKGSG